MTEPGGRILVVDDNRLNREKFAIMLQQKGHAVETAEDGETALERLQAGGIDVVMLDMVMPGLSGLQILERIKLDPGLRDTPVIIVSASNDMEIAVRCIQAGAEDYLPNDAKPVLLDARVQASLRRKRLRDLEKSYLQQEMALRQNEQLANLGRLSAGLAHELNNPASAVVRGASVMQSELPHLIKAQLKLAAAGLTSEQLDALRDLIEQIAGRSLETVGEDPLARSDREEAVEAWLSARDIAYDPEAARTIVDLGLDPASLDAVAGVFDQDHLDLALRWLSRNVLLYRLGAELGEAATRMSDVVHALRSYSYMEQAPLQPVDVNEGLNNTLIVLNSRLRSGITVERDFADYLPEVDAYGGELNQVWTNIIDNAIDAMDGSGTLRLRTRLDGDAIVVTIADDGPGIPPDALGRIYDPFFTTKLPGAGTGLGLNITHNIVVNRHNGRIDVDTGPDGTRFDVRIPLRHRPEPEEQGA